MSPDKAKNLCTTLVDHYGNNAIDIQGGEPTIYQDILPLTEHCRKIGLLPTLITNALRLKKKQFCIDLQNAGLRDLLISVHGIGETYDRIVGNIPNASLQQQQGIDNCSELGIPLRFNCVLSKWVLSQLADIAHLAYQKNVRVVNFIAFNPFEDQQLKGKRSVSNVPRYTEVKPALNEALDILSDAGIEANVRYFPICMVKPEHRKSVYNFQQLPYDIHEWDFASWSWTGMQAQRMREGQLTPVVNLHQMTYQPIQYKGPFKPLANWVKILAHSYPSLRPSAEKVHRKLSRLLTPIKINVSESPKDALYRINAKMRAGQHCRYTFDKGCSACSAKSICDGFHGDYSALFGTSEAEPILDERQINNPKHYIQHQLKIVESEDYTWAL